MTPFTWYCSLCGDWTEWRRLPIAGRPEFPKKRSAFAFAPSRKWPASGLAYEATRKATTKSVGNQIHNTSEDGQRNVAYLAGSQRVGRDDGVPRSFLNLFGCTYEKTVSFFKQFQVGFSLWHREFSYLIGLGTCSCAIHLGFASTAWRQVP